MALRTVLTLIGSGGITATYLASGAVTSAKLASGAVDSTALADDAVTTGKIAAGAVATSDLADDAVTTGKIATGAVGTTDIASDAVTAAKLDESDAFNFSNLSVSGVAVDPTKNLLYAVVDAVQASNITLSGGAPASVQGYSVQQNNDVLVLAQNTGSQNGIYNVDTVGSGNNGTWTRETTRDSAAEYPVGMLVFDKNSQKLYKLTAFAGTLGTDALTFEEHQEGMTMAANGEPVALGTGDGSTLDFDMPVVTTIVGCAVFVDGMLQDPSVWAISNGGGAGGVDRLSFTSGNAPASGAKVEIIAFTRE